MTWIEKKETPITEQLLDKIQILKKNLKAKYSNDIVKYMRDKKKINMPNEMDYYKR